MAEGEKTGELGNGALLERLRSIPATRVADALDEVARKKGPDAKAGIVLAPLTEEPDFNLEGQNYHFYAARVMPFGNKQNFVTPHYHTRGQEPYHFVSGKDGEMNWGIVQGDAVEWDAPQLVQPGDQITIEERQVHSFRNLGTEPYDFVFACPDAHLKDYDAEKMPEGDRFIVTNLKNGVPEHFGA